MSEKKLGFGMMRLPLLDQNNKGSVDIETTKKMVDTFLERGFTYFDTAYMYCDGMSERVVKEALALRHSRDSFTVTSKLPSYPLQELSDRDRVFNEQLEKTGLTYFDYYLLHNISNKTIDIFEKFDCFNWIVEKKRSGLVKKIGFSFHAGPDLLDKVLTEHPEFDYVQLQINYLDWESENVQSRACYETAVKHGKKIIIMEPVKGGALANVPDSVSSMFRSEEPDMSVASWAVRFAAGLPNVFMVLSGMSDMPQLLDNTGYMMDFKPLNDQQTKMVHFAADIINGNIAIACTGCSYCTVKCPQNIAIPQYFELHNKKKQGLDVTTDYLRVAGEYGVPGDCIGCRLCEESCPQNLEIRQLLTELAF